MRSTAIRVAKNYVNPANQIFSYLKSQYTTNVDKASDKDTDDADAPKPEATGKNKTGVRVPDASAHLTDRDKVDSSYQDNGYRSPFTYNGTGIGEYDLHKKASIGGGVKSWMGRIGSTKLSELNDWYRKVTLNSPLLRNIMWSSLVGLGAYALAPKISKALGGDQTIDPETGEAVYATKDTRRTLGWLAALASLGVNAYLDYTPHKPSSIFKDLPKRPDESPVKEQSIADTSVDKQITDAASINKVASMFGPIPRAPLSLVQTAAMSAPGLTPRMQYGVNQMLNAFPDPNTMVTSTDLVSAAINSGASAATGLPIGRIASAAVADFATAYGLGALTGVPHPGRLATTAGLVSAGARLMGGLF